MIGDLLETKQINNWYDMRGNIVQSLIFNKRYTRLNKEGTIFNNHLSGRECKRTVFNY